MGNSKKKICIVGTGGFGRETLCCLIDMLANTGIRATEVACFMVDDEYLNEKIIMGINVIPRSQFRAELYDAVVAVGSPKDRKKIVEGLPPDTTYTSIIHPTAVISSWVEIGEGSIVTAGTIITCNVKIGKHAQLNLHSTIGHDCVIGDYFTTAPAVNISGFCEFGNLVYIGTNASVRDRVRICDNVTIGMGATILKDITEEGIYIGNPARRLEKK
ncbi:MAG: acetyltransferase [Ferruginibacter sp.]